jgi:hypothetical protein
MPRVGASLLAKAVYQTTSMLNENRIREQARSHRGCVLDWGSAVTQQVLADFSGGDFLQLAQQVMR